MFAAAHDLVKGRGDVEDHASIFIFHQLGYHVEMLTKYCRAYKNACPKFTPVLLVRMSNFTYYN